MNSIKSPKHLFMRAMTCLHIVMLLMPVFSALNLSFSDRNDASLLYLTLMSGVLLVPTVLSRIAGRFVPGLIPNLLIDAALIALTGLLSFHLCGLLIQGDLQIAFTAALVFLSLQCVRGSISERIIRAAREKAVRQHDLSWTEPRIFLEPPSIRFEIWFVILYVLGLLFACPIFCSIALVLGTLYLCLALVYERLAGTDAFLEDLKDVSHIPVRRIRRIGDAAVLLLSAAVLIFGAVSSLFSGLRRYTDLRKMRFHIPSHLLEYSFSPKASDMQPEILRELARLRAQSGEPPRWLEPVTWVLAGIAMFFVIRFLIREFLDAAALFREGYDENGDYIHSLQEDQKTVRMNRRSRWERRGTPADKIRKEYRKRVEKQLPGAPEPSDTPDEIEKKAGIEDPDLHRRYEEARYK